MKLIEKLKTGESGKVYFMSDLHYNHSNIISMNSRPFNSVSDMNDWLVREISKVTENDVLIDLGDLFWSMSDCRMEDEFFNKVHPGKFIKIMGNHDNQNIFLKNPKISKHFDLICDLLDIQVDYNNTLTMCSLCHYGMLSWNHMAYGSLMLMGHSHGNLDEYNESVPDLRVDLGVDGKLCKSLGGSPLIEFSDIYNYFMRKTGGLSFQDWAKCKYFKF